MARNLRKTDKRRCAKRSAQPAASRYDESRQNGAFQHASTNVAETMRLGMRAGASTLALVAILLAAPSAFAPAGANGLYENRSWQFETTFDRGQKSAVQNLIELKKAGAYRSFNNYEIDYNIEGDYVNCAVSATSIGNQQSITQDAPIGSPSIAVTPTISADTVGNANDAAVSNDSGGALRMVNDGGSGSGSDFSGLGNSGSTSWNSNQSNAGASLSSGVDSSQITTSIGTASGTGGGGYAALNSSQGNTDVVIDATVSGSSACAFSRVTGTGSSQ